MLRIYFLQYWFNLSDPAVEEALYDSQAMRRCCHRPRPRAGAGRDGGVPLPPPARGAQSRPAAVRRTATALGGEGAEGSHWHDRRCDNHQCTSSTKNADKARDPEMPQTRKGDQWYFGMKAHFGAIMAGTADATAGGWSVPDRGGPIICGAVQHWLAGGSHQLTGRDQSWLTRRVAAELSANRLLLATKARRVLLQELALRPPYGR